MPGYDLTRFLGSGAYGEVWIGLDRNTGRQVAVKFYQHRGGVDWALLSREVEKLVLLSADRYVVQLLDVGWQADPPFYVMEYIENGSLEQLIQKNDGRTVEQTVELFREIVVGLNHAHAKGILHCDLKPANVLLDQDATTAAGGFRPVATDARTDSVAGHAVLHGAGAGGLKAVPDARWDVYALGAILYCMLVGKPPHMSDELLRRIEAAPDLPSRLQRYRQWIASKKPPDEHRKVPGVDRALAGIVDRCLAPRPSKRFANVQEVLDALRARDQARARRPLLLLGVLGPLLLLAVMAYGGRNVYQSALQESDKAVTDKVYQSNCVCGAIRRGQRGDGNPTLLPGRRARGSGSRACASASTDDRATSCSRCWPSWPTRSCPTMCCSETAHDFERDAGAPEAAAEDRRADGATPACRKSPAGSCATSAGPIWPANSTSRDVHHRRQFRQPHVLLRRAARPRRTRRPSHARPACAAHQPLRAVLQPRHEALEDRRVHADLPQR